MNLEQNNTNNNARTLRFNLVHLAFIMPALSRIQMSNRELGNGTEVNRDEQVRSLALCAALSLGQRPQGAGSVPHLRTAYQLLPSAVIM